MAEAPLHPDQLVSSGTRSSTLSAIGTLSAILIGLTLIVGSVAIVAARTYIAVGERMADLSGPEPDSSPAGGLELALQIATSPGVHRPLALSGVVILVFGIGAAIVGSITRAQRKHRLAREAGAFADTLRAERAQRDTNARH